MIFWILLDPKATLDNLGLLVQMLDENDPRPACEQFHEHYGHGGGWDPFEGHTLNDDNSITYPGDPPQYPIAFTRFHDELICVYDHAWVAIIQPDRSFEICRMD